MFVFHDFILKNQLLYTILNFLIVGIELLIIVDVGVFVVNGIVPIIFLVF